MTHEEKYEALCLKYGVKWSRHSPYYVEETLKSLREKYREDPHLNNVPLPLWDGLAAGFLAWNRKSGLSLAEAVCMQKHAAKKLLEETENEKRSGEGNRKSSHGGKGSAESAKGSDEGSSEGVRELFGDDGI